MPSPLPSQIQDLRDHVKYRVDWKIMYQHNLNTIGYPKSVEVYFKFIHNGLFSKVNVRSWYHNNPLYRNDSCPNCQIATETTVHMFLCPKWIPVWQFVVETLKPVFKIVALSKLLLPPNKTYRSPAINLIFFSTLRNIWLARCRIAKGKAINANWVEHRVQCELRSAIGQKFANLKSNTSREAFVNSYKCFVGLRNQNILTFNI